MTWFSAFFKIAWSEKCCILIKVKRGFMFFDIRLKIVDVFEIYETNQNI